MISEKQVEFYHTNGYLAVAGVLEADLVADLQRVTDEFVERARQLDEHTDVYDLEPEHSSAKPMVRRIKQPHLQHRVYDRTLRAPAILDIVTQLIGPGIRLHGTKLNMKIPEIGSAVQWHQDWGFYPHTNDDVLAVGVAIDDVTPENGGLLVIPGSHRGPVLDHREGGVFVGAVSECDFNEVDAVPVTIAAGGISIHHVRTLHASAPNRSAHPRRLMLLEMAAIDAWPLSGYKPYDQFNDKILRGEPSNEPRLERVPVLIGEPMPERVGSIYEIQRQIKEPKFR